MTRASDLAGIPEVELAGYERGVLQTEMHEALLAVVVARRHCARVPLTGKGAAMGATRRGLSVIVVTADLNEMSRIVDRVCVFSGGGIVETLYSADLAAGRLRHAAYGPRTASIAA